MNKKLLLRKMYILLTILIYIGLGFLTVVLYIDKKTIPDCDTTARVNGVWITDLEYLASYKGKFICINIDEVDNLKELDLVCKHEAGHEIFARYCEHNFDNCINITKR